MNGLEFRRKTLGARFFVSLFLLGAASAAYGRSQAREQIEDRALTYTVASDAGSLTYCAQLGIEPASP